MINFKEIKQQLSLPDVAMRYGLVVNRQRKALCPFHNDTHPSMLVVEDHYHCFTCGAHGDVFDLTAQLFSLRLGDAAKKLAQDYGFTDCECADVPVKPIERPKTEQDYVEALRRKVKLCEAVIQNEAPKTPEEEPSQRFANANIWIHYYRFCYDALVTGTIAEREEVMKDLPTDRNLFKEGVIHGEYD